ncbi:MAG: hypothetical protein AB7I30_12485 [Isosphaeraceae bacterium]
MSRLRVLAIRFVAASHRVSLVLAGLAVFLAPSPLRADESREALNAGRKLLAEGDELADKGETTEAVLRYKKAFEKLLPVMRKIPFTSEVKGDVTAREALKDVLLKEIEEEITPEEFRADELGMKALGLLPAEIDLKEVMIKIYSEEIAAFYDPKTKTMHLIKEPEAVARKKPGLLERLLGKTGGFDKDENKTVIAHELTHALADQNYDIEAMQKAIKDDDDRDLALSALIEGEATLTMIGAQMEDWDGSVVRDIPAANLDRIFSILTPLLPMTSGRSLREAPAILSESMIFPYLRGMVFCARLTNDGGWDALSAAYKRPPLSTEQILHPEKYSAQPDPPTFVNLGTLDPGEGWKEVGRNVVGEMQTAVLLRRHGGKTAAAGWDGDRFAVFEGPGGRLGLVWFSTWDTEKDAKEFQEGYVRFQATKLDEKAKDAAHVVQRAGQDVVVVEGFSDETTERLIASALKARKTEMSHER